MAKNAKKKPRKKPKPSGTGQQFQEVLVNGPDDTGDIKDSPNNYLKNIMLNAVFPSDAAKKQRDEAITAARFRRPQSAAVMIQGINAAYTAAVKTSEKMAPLVQQFVQKLKDDGDMISDSELAGLDRIILPNHIPEDVLQEADRQQSNMPDNLKDMMFRLLPCFRQGVLAERLSGFGAVHSVFIWTVESVDPEAAVMELTVRHELYCQGQRVPNITIKHAFVQIIRNDKDEYLWTILNKTETKSETSDMIANKLSARKLRWTNNDYQFWHDSVISLSRQHKQKCDPDNHGILQQNMMQNFFTDILLVNCILSLRVSHRKPASTPVPNPNRTPPEIRLDTQAPPVEEKLTRIICGVAFSSVKPPRKPSEKTLVQYRTAAWSVRGHVRHYKSGKTVYIQPTVHKRRALKDKTPEHAPARQVIELINPKKETSP